MNSSDPKARAFSTDELRAALRGDVPLARPGYLTGIVAEAGRTRQRPAWTFLGGWLPLDIGQPGVGLSRAAGVVMLTFLLVAVLVVATAGVYIGSQTKPVPVDLGIFAPVAGRVVYGDERGLWGVDPATPAAAAVQLTHDTSVPLGWSSDGTRLLLMRGGGPEVDADGQIIHQADEHLFVLHADGSETQVTDGPMSIDGATISPDGSRVVFASGALYAIDAQGGSAKVLVLQPDAGIRAPAYSPDGTRIAFMSGAGDNSNSVWLMNADGTDAHRIVDNQTNRRLGHVDGLSWSPAGDRLALGLGGSVYTFASDGSGFTEIVGCHPVDPCSGPESTGSPSWSPDGSRIAYTTGCLEGPRAVDRQGCHLASADPDGSNVLAFGSGASGPWHPQRR
jgi:dipeptidyl aminopeptidase/acylaminoacyl peptidase